MDSWSCRLNHNQNAIGHESPGANANGSLKHVSSAARTKNDVRPVEEPSAWLAKEQGAFVHLRRPLPRP